MTSLWLSPHPAVVLGIDAAETSGWGIVAPSRPSADPRVRSNAALYDFGVAKRAEDIHAAVSRAHDLALDLKLPFVAAGEDWQWSPRLPPKAYGALCERWGRWAQTLDRSVELELFGGDTPPAVLRVLCQTWRSALGLRQVVDAWVLARPKKDQGRAAWKRSACLAVKARFGVSVTDDIAEAICIALWGAHSQELADQLAPKPKRRRDAHA